jgi:hypothetical protein
MLYIYRGFHDAPELCRMPVYINGFTCNINCYIYIWTPIMHLIPILILLKQGPETLKGFGGTYNEARGAWA